jgi:glycosyltransferase involved in cell wall biosynthesis
MDGIYTKLPINLVILTPGFASDEKDTTAFPSLQLFTKFLSSHYPSLNIKIITFHYPFHAGKYAWNGIQVNSFAGKGRKWYKPFLWLKILIFLFRLRKSAGITIIHSFWLSETVFIGWLFCRVTGTGFLATAMGQDVTKQNKYLQILRLFSFNLIMISEFQSRYLKPFGKSNVFKIIPFGIDPSYFQGMTNKRATDVLGVGSLNSVKDYDQFLSVIEILVSRFPGICCKIIGEGIEKVHLKEVASAKGVDKNILFTGELSYEKVIAEMESAKLLLHTSRFEGQALVIMEALAAGQYVVTTPVGIATSLHSKKLMTGTTVEELSGHMISFLEQAHPDFTPDIHFTIEDTCKAYNSIYLALLPELRK